MKTFSLPEMPRQAEPQRYSLQRIVGDSVYGEEATNSFLCPICTYEYVHVGTPILGHGHGPDIRIPFSGECGSIWECHIDFHKGITSASVVVQISCANQESDETTGAVYFMLLEGHDKVKIGYSKNPQARLKQLQTGFPDRLLLVATRGGTMQLEQDLHRMFDAARISDSGEWFYLTEALKEVIAEHCVLSEEERQNFDWL